MPVFSGIHHRAIGVPPALNRAEEAELIGKLDAGDHNARQELITHNLRLVSHIARKYQIPGYGATT